MTYTITEIIQAKKNSERVNIYLNNVFWIGLSKNALLELQIIKGKVLSDLEKAEIERASLNQKLIDRAIRYLQIRPRSIAEIRDYLVLKKEVPEEDAESVITYLQENDLLSDEKFAQWYAEYKLRSGINGVNKITAELLKKRVDRKIIANVIEKFSANEEFQSEQREKIENYAKRVLPGIKAKDAYELKAKLTQKLLARGFKYDEIKKILPQIV